MCEFQLLFGTSLNKRRNKMNNTDNVLRSFREIIKKVFGCFKKFECKKNVESYRRTYTPVMFRYM